MIACVQMQLRAEDYHTEKSFETRIMNIMEQVRQKRGQGRLLVVFPEHIGTFCLLCNADDRVWSSKTFAQASRNLFFSNFGPSFYQLLAQRASPSRSLLLARSAEVERIYLSTFIKAAREYGAWIVAGSAALRWGETKRVYNTSPVITPTGSVIYRQHKVNLVEMEGKGGLDIEGAPFNYVSVVQSPFGNLGVTVCLDAFDLEIRERLQQLGAEIFIQPSANNHPWNEWQQKDWLRSSYAAVVENREFKLAVNPMLVGSLWDLTFEGQSSIIGQDGYIAQAETYNQEEILLAEAGFM